jgi:5-methylcytosine-specific restriction protein A
MARQDSFTDNLDCLENTISLCPCCHRKIHYAIDEEKIQILDLLLVNKKLTNKFDIDKNDLIEIYI